MYQKLVIREADAHMRVWTHRVRTKDNHERNRWHSRDDVIRPDRMIICSDWQLWDVAPLHKNDDGRECEKVCENDADVIDSNRVIVELRMAKL
jgi:hypothetical protein